MHEALEELYQIKEELSLKYNSARELGEAAHQFAIEHRLRPAGPHRKMIDGFPRGQSVADLDEIMREVYQTKEQLAAEYDDDRKKVKATINSAKRPRGTKTPRKSKSPVPFRQNPKTKK